MDENEKALVVGINHYPKANNLYGCVNDAKRVSQLLKRNGNGSINFDAKERYGDGTKDEEIMIKELLHDPIFLAGKSEVATKEYLQVAQDLLDTMMAHKDSSVGMAA